jgi:hypothetical protein
MATVFQKKARLLHLVQDSDADVWPQLGVTGLVDERDGPSGSSVWAGIRHRSLHLM